MEQAPTRPFKGLGETQKRVLKILACGPLDIAGIIRVGGFPGRDWPVLYKCLMSLYRRKRVKFGTGKGQPFAKKKPALIVWHVTGIYFRCIKCPAWIWLAPGLGINHSEACPLCGGNIWTREGEDDHTKNR